MEGTYGQCGYYLLSLLFFFLFLLFPFLFPLPLLFHTLLSLILFGHLTPRYIFSRYLGGSCEYMGMEKGEEG